MDVQKKGLHTELWKKNNNVQIWQMCKSTNQDASSESNSIPCWSIGLKRSVRGNGTFAKKKTNLQTL